MLNESELTKMLSSLRRNEVPGKIASDVVVHWTDNNGSQLAAGFYTQQGSEIIIQEPNGEISTFSGQKAVAFRSLGQLQNPGQSQSASS